MCQRLMWIACFSITVLHLVSSALIPPTVGHATKIKDAEDPVIRLADMMCSLCQQLNDFSCMQKHCLNVVEPTPVSVSINSNIGPRTINKMAAFPPKQKSADRLAVAV